MNSSKYTKAQKKFRLLSISIMVLTLLIIFVSLFCFPVKIVPGVFLVGFVLLTCLVIKMTDEVLKNVINDIEG